MSYKSATAAIATIYVVASLTTGGYSIWAAIDNFGARHDPDGITRAQFYISIFMLAACAATIALVIGSLVAARRQWFGGRRLWFMLVLLGLLPLLAGMGPATQRLGVSAFIGLGVPVVVTGAAVIVGRRSPAWLPEPKTRVAGVRGPLR